MRLWRISCTFKGSIG